MSKHYHPRRKPYPKHFTPLPELMAMARGRWVEIMTAAGIPEDALAGWLGVIPGYRSWHVAPAVSSPPVQSPVVVNPQFALMAEVMTCNMRPGWLAKAATMLGVTSEALARLSVGWSPVHRAVSWPMRDDSGQVVGIRLRCPVTSRKWAVTGSSAGLFYGVDLLGVERPGRVYVAEGPTDSAALLSVGLDAVGVPSAGGCRDLLLALLRRIDAAEVVIVADGDGPGMRGAVTLGVTLRSVVPVRIINPPQGVKDARAWVVGGADALVIEATAERALVQHEVNGGAI